MSQSQGLTLSEIQSFFHDRGNDFADALGGFLQGMSGSFANTAEDLRRFSEFMQQRMASAYLAASNLAAGAAAAGNLGAERLYSQLAAQMQQQAAVYGSVSLREAVAATSNQLRSFVPGAVANAIDAAKVIDAAVAGDWNKVGNELANILAGSLLAAAGLVVGAAVGTVLGLGVVGTALLAGLAAGALALLGDTYGAIIWDGYKKLFGLVSETVGDLFNSAQRWVRPRDPLVLDLDGDGIETVGANLANPILFDHDADGVLTGTGWVRPDDGLLVMDRNGNGAIDNGRELFGDATLLPNGQTAADGFAALRPLDGNNDGIVNAADADFAHLRVWRDLDQDGVSDQGELFTLASLGISGIRTGATAVNQNLGNGNVLNQRGTYVRSNGTEGTAGTVQEVSNLNFAEDTFNRRFTDQVPILDEVRSLPNMAASGMVRDLWEAANDTRVRVAA